MGEGLNHTAARKPGHLYIIQYSLVVPAKGSSFDLKIFNITRSFKVHTSQTNYNDAIYLKRCYREILPPFSSEMYLNGIEPVVPLVPDVVHRVAD